MSEADNLPDRLRDLIDDYADGILDEAGLAELEQRLSSDPNARDYFARYLRLHTDLHLEERARRAGAQALAKIAGEPPPPVRPISASSRTFKLAVFLVAASVLFAVGLGLWLLKTWALPSNVGTDTAVAWLVNAQNCTWSDGDPSGSMHAGKILNVEHGLAEIHFRGGARVVLEGPARLELLSDKSARLLRGKLTARAPGSAAGFEILAPHGKVIDLGTEFGVAVADDGAADVYVFEGKVVAHPADSKSSVSLGQNESAHISADRITIKPPVAGADQFVRAIVPAPVLQPRTVLLDFDRPGLGGLLDAAGVRTGLTHRLPGTGSQLPERDPNLRVVTAKRQLELTTTNSDINRQFKLPKGEYLGVRLTDLGFTGKEDFAITATILDIPALEFIGQFGLYAGTRSDENIRGGVINFKRKETGSSTQFLVNDHKGLDTDLCQIGLLSTGTDLRLTLKRAGGKYSLTVENLTDGSASTLTIRHPEFLDGESDLYVGLFAANPRSDVQKTLLIQRIAVTVWTAAPPEAQK